MIAVVHLIWGPLGPLPLRRFLESYLANPPGADHQFALFNGVSDDRLPALNAELKRVEHHALVLEQPVQDLAAYALAAERLAHERLCFLNSHSAILAPDWLARKLACARPAAGWACRRDRLLVSLRSAALNALFLPSPGGVFPERKLARELYRSMDLEREGGAGLPPSRGGAHHSARYRPR